jgi:hypothetical protein
MFVWEREVRQHVVFGEVHQLCEPLPAGTEPVGDASPGGSSTLRIRLIKHRADRRGDHLFARSLGTSAKALRMK